MAALRAGGGAVGAFPLGGGGIYVDELRRELRRRGLKIPSLAHDLFA